MFQRCMIPFRCVVFIAGVDQALRTFILPVMAAHFYLFASLFSGNSAQIWRFARASNVQKSHSDNVRVSINAEQRDFINALLEEILEHKLPKDVTKAMMKM